MKKQSKSLTELSRYDFSKALNVHPAWVTTYITRGKIFVNENGFIDIQDKRNVLFIEEMRSKGKTFDVNRIMYINEKKSVVFQRKKEEEEEKEKEIKTANLEVIGDVAAMQREKMALEVERLKNQSKLDNLKIEKMEGNLIPVDAVIHLFTNSIMTVKAQYTQGIEKIAMIFKQKTQMSHNEYIEIMKDLKETVNQIHKDSKKELLQGIDGIVDEYQEVRGRGERK